MYSISNALYFRIYHNIFNIVKGIAVFKDFPLVVIKMFPDIKGLSMHSICIYRIFMNLILSQPSFFFVQVSSVCLRAIVFSFHRWLLRLYCSCFILSCSWILFCGFVKACSCQRLILNLRIDRLLNVQLSSSTRHGEEDNIRECHHLFCLCPSPTSPLRQPFVAAQQWYIL